MKSLILSLALLLSCGCALHPSAPPNLTPHRDREVLRDLRDQGS